MQFSKVQQNGIIPIFSPCGNYFITMNQNNIFIKQSSIDLKNICQMSIKISTNTNPIEYPTVQFTQDSQLIAVHQKNKVQVYDIQGRLKFKIQNSQDGIAGIQWTTGSSYQLMVFYSYQSKIKIFNIQTQSQSIIKNPKFSTKDGCTFSKSTSKMQNSGKNVQIQKQGLFTAILQRHNSKDCVGIYFTQTWQLINHFVLDTSDAARIQFTAFGNIIVYQSLINFRIIIIDPYMGVIQQYNPNSYTLGVNIEKNSNNNLFLALGAHDQNVHLLNAITYKPIGLFPLIFNNNQFNKQFTIIYKEDPNTRMFGKFQLNSIKLVQKIQSKSNKTNKQSQFLSFSIIQFSFNDKLLAIKSDLYANCIFIWDVQSLKLFSVLIFDDTYVRDFKWLQNQQTLVIANGTHYLTYWNSQQEPTHIICQQKLKITNILLGKQKQMLLYSNTKKLYSFAIRTEEIYHQ